jgi:hypothetical protein
MMYFDDEMACCLMARFTWKQDDSLYLIQLPDMFWLNDNCSIMHASVRPRNFRKVPNPSKVSSYVSLHRGSHYHDPCHSPHQSIKFQAQIPMTSNKSAFNVNPAQSGPPVNTG